MAREVLRNDVVWLEGWIPSDEILDRIEYWVEGNDNDEDHVVLWTMDDLKAWFDEWDQSLQEEDPEYHYNNVYDFLEDALWEGIHPVDHVKGEDGYDDETDC